MDYISETTIEKINSFKKSLIGESYENAILICKKNKLNYRFVRKDTTKYIITEDLCFYRLSMEIDNNIVTKCENY